MNDLFSRIRSLELTEKIIFIAVLFLFVTIVIWVLDFMLSLEFLGLAVVAYVLYQVFIKKD